MSKFKKISKIATLKRQWVGEIHVQLTTWKVKQKQKRFCFSSFNMISIWWFVLLMFLIKCTKFRGSGGSVSSCPCVYFMGANFFLLGILLIQTYFEPKKGAYLYTIVNENNLKKIDSQKIVKYALDYNGNCLFENLIGNFVHFSSKCMYIIMVDRNRINFVQKFVKICI